MGETGRYGSNALRVESRNREDGDRRKDTVVMTQKPLLLTCVVAGVEAINLKGRGRRRRRRKRTLVDINIIECTTPYRLAYVIMSGYNHQLGVTKTRIGSHCIL